MAKNHLILGSTLALLSVMIGAFGAHALAGLLEANGRTGTFETAVQYHQFHSLAILMTGILLLCKPSAGLKWTNLFFLAGIVFFSGSLYILSLTGLTPLGAAAPVGGLCFIVGWILLIHSLIKAY